MPKDRRGRSLSRDLSRASPYPRSSKNATSHSSKNGDRCKPSVPLPPVGDEKEWDEARCPICMEHPHNAVLLLCSSHEKGCHPYMCDTSYRHSNCLDQFCKSSEVAQSTEEDALLGAAYHSGNEGQVLSRPARMHGKRLVCPLCRGKINGWVVIEPSRQFMNRKQRSCPVETCGFSGNYSELSRHAKLEHPSVCPLEVDPRRQHDWTRLERQRDFEDFLGAFQLEPGDEWSEDSILHERDGMVLEHEIDLGEHEIDLGDFLSAVHRESEDDWSEDVNFRMDFEIELSLPSMRLVLRLDPWFEPIEFGSSRASSQSPNDRSTRSGATNHIGSIPATGHTNISTGRLPPLRQRRRRLNRRRSSSSN